MDKAVNSTVISASYAIAGNGGSAAALYGQLVIAQEHLGSYAANIAAPKTPQAAEAIQRLEVQISETQRRIAASEGAIAPSAGVDAWA